MDLDQLLEDNIVPCYERWHDYKTMKSFDDEKNISVEEGRHVDDVQDETRDHQQNIDLLEPAVFDSDI